MAQGQLKRETNPVSGTVSGFLPQHESNTPDEFVVTGENNPHPVKIKEGQVGITNFPENQSVTDAQVKAELELVKSELQAVKTALQGTISTQLTGSLMALPLSIGKDLILESELITVAGDGVETVVLDISDPCIIEHIDWATNNPSAQLRMVLYRKDGSNNGWGELIPDASGISGMSATSIKNYGSANWDVIEFNESTNSYRFINKKELVIPTRIVISCRLLSGASANFRFYIRGRKM